MAKKLVKRKKFKVFHFLIFLFIIGILVFLIYLLLNSKIRNINIYGNKYLSDEEILEQAELTDYPAFFRTFSYQIKQKLQKLPIVKTVTIKKGFFHVFNIYVDEYPILLKNGTTNQYILASGEELELTGEYRVPKLLNTVSKEKYDDFIEEVTNIKASILGEISEMKYVPNEYDKDRFLLYMNDGNSVYLTLTKFEMINYYHKVLPQLEGRKGILYLDSGNHFKIME